MRKIKLQKQPIATLVLGALMIALGFNLHTPPGRPAPPAPAGAQPSVERPAVTSSRGSGPQTTTAPAQNAAATVAYAGAPVPAAPAASAAVKYPGLPNYPHVQYQYHSLSLPAGPLYPMEPFLDRISASAAWDTVSAHARTAAPIVAVIDTGFALDHEALTGRWALNPGETQGSLTDADGDGYIGNWRGWDFVDNLPDPLAGRTAPTAASVSHGTRTAGLAGLLDPTALIMPLQALGDTGSGYTDDVAAAVRYAADHGAKVISLSLGSSADDPYLHSQIDYAIGKGAVVVAAAGNDGCDCLLYPAAYPEVLAVGASTSTDTRASFSSYGAALDVLAPGTGGDFCSTNFTSTNATTSYGCSYNGTSFATPIVAGLAAQLEDRCPDCTNVDIITAIELGADQLAGANGALHSDASGYGRIDVARSIALLTEPAATPTGQLVSKHGLSLSALSLQDGPLLDSTCVGAPGASCALTFEGPQGQTISGGQQTLDFQYGGAVFYWNASALGLTPGQWKVMTTITWGGTTASTLADIITVLP